MKTTLNGSFSLLVLRASASIARAQLVITFDDIQGAGPAAMPSTYAGFTWNNFGYLNSAVYDAAYAPKGSGYYNGTVSPPNVAYNYASGSISSGGFSCATPFNLVSADITAAWYNGLSVEVDGYNGASLVYSNIYTVDTTGPSLITFNYSNITSVTFNSYGGVYAGLGGSGIYSIALDDVTLTGKSLTWTNTSGGNWSEAANWNPNQVPGPADTASVTNAGTYTLTLDVNATVCDLTIGGAISGVQNVQGNNSLNARNVTVSSGGILSLANSTLNGSMVVGSGAMVTVDGMTLGAQVTVASGGEFLLAGSASALGLAGPGDTNYWLAVQSGGLLDSASGAGMSLYSVVTNAGVINLTNSTLTINNYPGYGGGGYVGGLVNEAAGTINLWAGAGVTGNSFGGEYLINQGAIVSFSTNSTSTINVDFLTNSATLSAQHGTLQLEANNQLTLLPSGTLNIGLNSATDFGSITYNDSAALNLAQAGTLQVTLNGGYVPAVGSSFKVLSAIGSGTFSGAFANFSSPSGAIWETNYTAASLILTNVGQITWATPSAITYGAALGGSQLNASTTPVVAGTFAYNPVAGTVLDSGAGQLLTATFTPSVTGDAPTSFQVPITVLKAPLGVTANSQTKTYGQNFNFAGTEFVPTGLVNGDTVTSASLASAGAISNAPVSGSPYAINVNNALGDPGLTNYIITYTNGILTVNPAQLGIIANSQSKTYGQNLTFAGTEFVSGPLQNSETIGTVTLTSSGAISNAPVSGSPYRIVPSAAVGGTFTPGNYAIIYTNGTLTVNPAGLTVTANDAARTYGAANPAFSVSYSGFVNNETASVISGMPGFSTPATLTSGVGGYTITPSLGTLSAANYSFGPFNNGTLTINTAALSITASNLSKTYGQAVTFAGTEFAASGLLNSDTVTHATLTSAGAISNAPVAGSPYSIVPSAATGSGLTNYTIAYNNGQLTVNKALLTITANPTNKIAGETLTFAGTEFAASGLQNSETVGSVTLISAGAPASAPVANYNIVPSAPAGGTFSQANYSDNFVNGTLTVFGPPVLTLTALGNQCVLTFETLPCQMYQLQSKTNLAIAGWSSVGGPIVGTGGTLYVTNSIASPQSFFKLQIAP